MNSRSPLHIVLFLVVGSLLGWLSMTFGQVHYAISVPQGEAYCIQWEPIPEGVDAPERAAGSAYYCTAFTSELERLKYYHNLRAVDRTGTLFWIVSGAGFLAALTLFVALPRLRQTPYAKTHSESEDLLIAFVLALVLGFVPRLISALVPPPAYWMPDTIVEYVEARRTEALRELEAQSAAEDSMDHSRREQSSN